MGLGGNLIWTGVFDAIRKQSGRAAIACDTPMPTDLLRGYGWRRDRDYRNDLIFKGNPDIDHVTARPKSAIAAMVDLVAEKLLSPDPVRRFYEKLVFGHCLRRWKAGKGPLLVHIDMRIHSYASGQDSKYTYWKEGGCAAHVMAAPFGFSVEEPVCRFVPAVDEDQAVLALLARQGIDGAYIVIEPDTNRDWFGELRAWPMKNWQAMVDDLRRDYPDLAIVQTGLGRGGILDGVIDLTGQTSFREAASLLQHATLFVGTEGGLMHLAAAMDTRSVILWGGITLPEFAGYPHLHHIICHYVACAPCGHAGWCDNGHMCMNNISVTETGQAIRTSLAARSCDGV